MVIRALWISGLLAALSPCQTTAVLPQSHQGQEGTGFTNLPFGRAGDARVQMAYHGMLFPGPGTITRIGMRLDGGTTSGQKQVDCEVRMSTMPLALQDLALDFARNRGGDETVVLPRQVITLPAHGTAATPNPFHLHLDLAQTFPYDPAQGPLLVEIVVRGGFPGPYALDTTYACQSPQSVVGPAGCPGSSGLPLRVESATTQVMWGRAWVVRALDASPGALTALVLGTRDSGVWNGWTLPFDLGGLGAPGCFLSIDVAASFQQVAAGDGSATFTFNIPALPATVGIWLPFQAGAVDLGANALGVVTSQARKVQICGWEPVGRVYATDSTAASGLREIGVAPVLEVTFQ